MRRICVLFLPLMVLGCQDAKVESTDSEASAVKVQPVATPATLTSTDVALTRAKGSIHVGSDWGDVQAAIPQPENAFVFSDLPVRFQKPYQAKGWETATDGLGVILFEDHVVLAMYQQDKASLFEYSEVTARYEKSLPKAMTDAVISGDLKFRFWEQDGQRAMVFAQQMKGGQLRLAEAIGDATVMDELSMNAAAARRNAAELARILSERNAAHTPINPK